MNVYNLYAHMQPRAGSIAAPGPQGLLAEMLASRCQNGRLADLPWRVPRWRGLAPTLRFLLTVLDRGTHPLFHYEAGLAVNSAVEATLAVSSVPVEVHSNNGVYASLF